MIIEAIWDGTYTATCAKRLKLPPLKGLWLTDEIQILEEPQSIEDGRLVALANVYHSLCFIALKVTVKDVLAQEAPRTP